MERRSAAPLFERLDVALLLRLVPWATLTLAGVLIAVHRFIGPRLDLAVNADDLDPWTLLSSPFLHLSTDHLQRNLVGLLLTGSFVEPLLRRTSTLCLFITTAATGNLVESWVGGSFVLGASGGVYALGAAMVMLAPVLAAGLREFMLLTAPSDPVRRMAGRIAWSVLGIVLVAAVAASLWDAHLAFDSPWRSQGRAAYAHVTGAALGAIVGLVVAAWHLVERLRIRSYLKRALRPVS